MTIEPRLDILGAALADPSRTRMLCELMDGRAFTNKELAAAAGIQPQTATAHLRQLQDAGLTHSLRSGRHIYHRLAGAEVAEVLERLSALSPLTHLDRPGKASADTRLARSCYNHLAGHLGIALAARLLALDVLRPCGDHFIPGGGYTQFASHISMTPPPLASPKPVAKACLDWTERRLHVSGPFGTALFALSLKRGWLERRVGSRALTVTEAGRTAFVEQFGLSTSGLTMRP